MGDFERIRMDIDPHERRMNGVLAQFEESSKVEKTEREYRVVHRDVLFAKAMLGLFSICLDRPRYPLQE